MIKIGIAFGNCLYFYFMYNVGFGLICNTAKNTELGPRQHCRDNVTEDLTCCRVVVVAELIKCRVPSSAKIYST